MQGNMSPRLTLRTREFQRMMRARGRTTATAQAEALGVQISTVTRVCAGKVQPSSDFVARACIALDAALGDLFEVVPGDERAVA